MSAAAFAPAGAGLDSSRYGRLPRALVIEHHLFGASLLRIGLGCVVLYQLLRHWAERDFLWGPRGVYPFWLFQRELPVARAPSFFAVDSELLFQLLYGLTIGAVLLYVLGWQTRWIAVWVYVLIWSLSHRNPMVLAGGDRLLLAMFPFVLLLMNTSAYLSADSRWRRIGDPWRPSRRPFVALFHNLGLFCIFVQLCIVYGFSGFAKLLGEPWRDGTAVYYVLRSAEFTLPGVSPIIYHNAVLVPLLTYATLFFELSFPLLIWSSRTRWILALQAVTFHIFIAVFLGLVLFAAQALIFQFVLFDDARYRAVARRLPGSFRGPGARDRRARPTTTPPPTPA
jgi:hypothetical protein